jgi:hypothetical protein
VFATPLNVPVPRVSPELQVAVILPESDVIVLLHAVGVPLSGRYEALKLYTRPGEATPTAVQTAYSTSTPLDGNVRDAAGR